MRKERIIEKLITAILIIFIIGVIGFGIYVLAAYGGKPITEIPSWVVPFFLGK